MKTRKQLFLVCLIAIAIVPLFVLLPQYGQPEPGTAFDLPTPGPTATLDPEMGEPALSMARLLRGETVALDWTLPEGQTTGFILWDDFWVQGSENGLPPAAVLLKSIVVSSGAEGEMRDSLYLYLLAATAGSEYRYSGHPDDVFFTGANATSVRLEGNVWIFTIQRGFNECDGGGQLGSEWVSLLVSGSCFDGETFPRGVFYGDPSKGRYFAAFFEYGLSIIS